MCLEGNVTPEPRDSHSCAKIKNNMYIFGGSNGDNPIGDMYAFNFTSKNWTKIIGKGQVPSAREGHSFVAAFDRYLILYGGWNGKTIFND